MTDMLEIISLMVAVAAFFATIGYLNRRADRAAASEPVTRDTDQD